MPSVLLKWSRHNLQGTDSKATAELVLKLEELNQTFTILGITEKPVLSALRDYSAPVKLEAEGQTEEDLAFLLANDTDSFNRWEASQTLQRLLVIKLYNAAIKRPEVLICWLSSVCQILRSCLTLRLLLDVDQSYVPSNPL